MFKKEKSVPEKIVDFVGDKVDGHVTGIAKNFGIVAATLAVVAVGASAAINAVREGGDEQ